MTRRVAVLTTGRQDYGILRSTLLRLRDDREIELLLVAAGMCLSEEHGMPVHEIEQDGFSVTKRIARLTRGADGPDDDWNPGLHRRARAGIPDRRGGPV